MQQGPFGLDTLDAIEDTETLLELHERLMKLSVAVKHAGEEANSLSLADYHEAQKRNTNRVESHIRARRDVPEEEFREYMEEMEDWLESRR